jgi:predicted GIY-YIG superfamily endonuclease
MKTLYCLELARGRYYVGQTPKGRLNRRLWEHDHGGAKWTTRFPPRRLLWSKPVQDRYADTQEDEENIKIMRKHGRNASRGGTFNICRDIKGMPSWAGPRYVRFWAEIEEASL